MIEAELFVLTVVALVALSYVVIVMLVRENRALARAVIANNAKDFAIVEHAATSVAPKKSPKRAVEGEADFTEPRLAPLGLS